MREVEFNSTNVKDYFLLSTEAGIPKTGLANTDVDISYMRAGGSRVAITDSALAAVSSNYASGGFKEVDATNMPGLYRVDIPDAAWVYALDAEGLVSRKVYVEIKPTVATTFKSEAKEFYLVPKVITQGIIGAVVDSQPTYTQSTFVDGTVRKDYK